MRAESDIVYRPISRTDVEPYRAGRLRALREDASAFAERFEDASAQPLSRWVERVADDAGHERTTTQLAWLDGGVVGMATGRLLDPDGSPELIGMWVAPEARGLGVGTELLSRIAAWATRASAHRLELWVITDNGGAIDFYERCGFVVKHDHRAQPDDPCRDEVRMVLGSASPEAG